MPSAKRAKRVPGTLSQPAPADTSSVAKEKGVSPTRRPGCPEQRLRIRTYSALNAPHPWRASKGVGSADFDVVGIVAARRLVLVDWRVGSQSGGK